MWGLATRILVPDEIEKRRAKRVFKASLELDGRIVMGSLQETGVSSPLKGGWAQKVLSGSFAENRAGAAGVSGHGGGGVVDSSKKTTIATARAAHE